MHTEKSSRYQLVIIACCFLMIFTVLGFSSTPRKLFMVAVPKALELDYGPYSLNDSCRYVATSVMNLMFGALVLRFGPRKLIGAGFLFQIAAMLLYSVAESLPVIYLGGTLLGMGLTITGTTMSSYVINIWCPKNKGTITGLVLCANGVGGAVSTQILSPIIASGTFAYRDAYRVCALILVVVGTLIVTFIRNSPAQDASLPGMKKKQARAGTWEGITLQEALKKPYFYIACACIFLTGMMLQSVVGSDANHMHHVGLDAGYVASVLSIHSLVLSGSKFLTGVLYDHKGLKTASGVCYMAAFLTLLTLVLMSNSLFGKVMAASYSALAAMALPLETIMLPLITAEMFGQRSYAQMLGIVSAVNTAGFALGPPITNFVFDAIGSYTPVFTVYLVVMLLTALAFLYAVSCAQRSR